MRKFKLLTLMFSIIAAGTALMVLGPRVRRAG